MLILAESLRARQLKFGSRGSNIGHSPTLMLSRFGLILHKNKTQVELLFNFASSLTPNKLGYVVHVLAMYLV